MADHPRKQPYLKRNKCFQLLLIPTVNQILWHCSNSQSALWPKSGRSEHKLVRVCIRPLSSAEASLCCVGEAGEKEKERACLLPLPITKPPPPPPPRPRTFYFYRDTQREPLQRREVSGPTFSGSC